MRKICIILLLLISADAYAGIYVSPGNDENAYMKDMEILKKKIALKGDPADIAALAKLCFALEDFPAAVKYADMYLAVRKSREMLYLKITSLANLSQYGQAVKSLQMLIDGYSMPGSERKLLMEKMELYKKALKSKPGPSGTVPPWGKDKSIAGIHYREGILAGFDHREKKPFSYSIKNKEIGHGIPDGIFSGLDFQSLAFFSVSADGNEILASVVHDAEAEVLHRKRLKNGTWSGWTRPGTLNKGNANSFAGFLPDGKHAIFVSDRDNAVGFDIYIAERDAGTWTRAYKLAGINTVLDESSVVVQPDGETVYFSSNGRQGAGGYDMYYARLIRTAAGFMADNIINLDPVNTYRNDIGPLFADIIPDTVYYNHSGSGVYSVFQGIASPMPKPVSFLDVYVYARENNEPLDAEVKLIGSDGAVYENSTYGAGYAAFMLTRGKSYQVTLSSAGYIYRTLDLEISGSSVYVKKKYFLEKGRISKGYSFEMDNIYFDTGSYTIREESLPALERLYDFIIKNPSVKINISGNTDNIGTYDYNMALSKQRADSIAGYLKGKGIASGRMKTEGFGYLRNIAPNVSEAERQKNRRVEISVLSAE